MYYIKKRIEISAAHSLKLAYPSKCENLHGHNWIITVFCRSEYVNDDGMVTDFTVVKDKITEHLDHKNLNEVFLEMNPTAENLAYWICCQIPNCYKVIVEESEDNSATYEKD